MGIIVDLIIIGIILLSTFLAYKKGLVKLAIGLCAFVISIVITFVLYQPITSFIISNTQIDETIENAIYEKANEIIKENESQNSGTSQILETAKNGMLPETARNLSINIVRGGTMIVLFVAVQIALKFVTVLADAIAKLPIIDQINKAGGTIYGVLRGTLLVYVILLVLAIPGKINPNNIANESIDKSSLGKVMYQNNILNIFFKW